MPPNASVPPKRFSQRYTTFARARWDPTCLAHPDLLGDLDHSPGVRSRDAHALHAGGWVLARGDRVSIPADTAPDRPPPPADSREPEALTRRVKRAARFYGAALVGVARVNPLWVYACDGEERPIELPQGLGTAVVMAVGMDYHLIRTSPALPAGAATGQGYARMRIVGASLVTYLHELGYRALYAGNDTALSVPLAVDAGLGEVGRHGMLITPEYGPRVRLCKVFTNAPLAADRPRPFGVDAFCKVCLKCVTSCASGAIPRGPKTTAGPTPSNCSGALKWYVNGDRCLRFWKLNGANCSNCIRSCPFNKLPGPHHSLARQLIRLRSPLLNRALVRLDDGLGYGRRWPCPAVA